MNPELIERPHEIAYYQEQREMERRERVPVVFTWGLAIGFLAGMFWRMIFKWIGIVERIF